MHLGGIREESQDGAVAQDLAAIVVIGVGGIAHVCFIDHRTRRTVEHGDGRGLDEAAHARRMGLPDQGSRAVNIDALEHFPMAAPLVVVAKERRGMEHHIAAMQGRGKRLDIGHVANHEFDAREVAELLPGFFRRTHQRLDRDAAAQQFAHKIVAEQAGGAGHESGLQVHGWALTLKFIRNPDIN